MPARLKNGVIGAPGGKREGAGRKPDWFKAWVDRILHDPKKRKRLEKILDDAEDAETLVTPQGVEVPTRARADTYLRALEWVANYAKGKPVQTVIEEVGESAKAFLIQAVEENRKARGLDL